ncbi:allantoinase AllB [Neobacillus dielmonensis]|uniref:allantoinase AllB n=1 Tax=Neobacillus dielmonensis TaxID=1347369 RepID=UPI0005AAC976|nr:allantoinase AllB [Neobacillus dielmonensis]
MTATAIITNGKVVTPKGVVEGEIEITAGKISNIAATIPRKDHLEVIDAKGQYILPGMIDTHVHINEPGRTDWEGFETGSKALAAGGVTAYIDMPLNALPATTTKEALEKKITLASGKNYIDYAFYGGLTPDNLDNLEELADGGAIAYKCFLSTYQTDIPGDFKSIDDYMLLEGMKRIAALGKILLIHCENDQVTDGLERQKVREGKTSAYDFVDSRPILAEVEAVSRVILFAKATGCPVHIVHVSSAEAVTLIEKAKLEGVNITLESCPHYFALNADDLARIGPVAKCQPPLRYPKEQEALWECLLQGKIDWVSSDHSPCTSDLKQGSIFEAHGGISGAQNSVDVMFDLAVNKRGMSVVDFANLIACQPAKRFSLLEKGEISEGYDADLILIDPSLSYTVCAEGLYYKNPHSPYIGMEIGARVTKTFLRGELVFSIEEGIVGEPKGKSILNSVPVVGA